MSNADVENLASLFLIKIKPLLQTMGKEISNAVVRCSPLIKAQCQNISKNVNVDEIASLSGKTGVSAKLDQFMYNVDRRELITIIVKMSISTAAIYFGCKWMVNNLDPTHKQKVEAQKRAEDLLKRIGVKNLKLSEYELSIAANLVDPLDVSQTWSDIGGLDDIIEEIKETIIAPFEEKSLFEDSNLLQPPKGILLYGPPGCGKTMIAKALAKEAGARFINLQVSALTDKWYGESQKLASAIFSVAEKLQPCIIFIDEIDSFLRLRSSNDHEATAMMKAQFMSLWDGLATNKECNVILMGATNRPQDLDEAILRRMPTMFHIVLPNEVQRESIVKLILKKERVAYDLDYALIANLTVGFSGSDLKEMCRVAAVSSLRDCMKKNSSEKHTLSAGQQRRSMMMKDFIPAIEKIKVTKKAGVVLSLNELITEQNE